MNHRLWVRHLRFICARISCLLGLDLERIWNCRDRRSRDVESNPQTTLGPISDLVWFALSLLSVCSQSGLNLHLAYSEHYLAVSQHAFSLFFTLSICEISCISLLLTVDQVLASFQPPLRLFFTSFQNAFIISPICSHVNTSMLSNFS